MTPPVSNHLVLSRSLMTVRIHRAYAPGRI
jgi:hypothetical protein